ncbi:hypothetical protein P9314_27210 [Paenibacillus validus]|uniref:hypothetical protein n=1 Tax=Paenibacillus TaxID=44249 RepID=UPI0006CF2281|nr:MULTISPECIES: hypothetical protein [Paenibacillus]MED4604322.1 hypothetical protein [Paenibacillus validus]MED4608829.1 hypothetical protein [Paenibacillus validus]
MSRYDSSLQSQNPISQAQNSVEKAHHAVTQAQSHPTAQMIEQAETAVDKAQRSIAQAVGHEHAEQPMQLAQESLAEDQAALQSVKPSQS